MRSNSRLAALPMAACASLLLVPTFIGLSHAVAAEDIGEDAPIEDIDYDYGDADYVPPNPVYIAARRAVASKGLSGDDLSTDELGAHISVAAGVDLEQLYDVTLTRFEIEIGYLNQFGNDATQINPTVVTGFASIYRDLGEFYSVRPYVGAGIGVAHVDSNIAGATQDDSIGIAWHATAGLSIDWSEHATVDLGYRYTGIEDLDIQPAGGSGAIDRFDAHAVFTGLRFRL